MKKLKVLLLVAALAGLSACRRHSTIIETGDHYYLKIEYSGSIYFNDEGTAISSISPGGYVKYEYNGEKLEARHNRHGGISYELYDNGEKLNPYNEGKAFIAGAVRVMLMKNHRPNWK